MPPLLPEIPDLHIFFLTVGENVAIESLRALKEHTIQPYKLTIWYDACGREIDWGFYEMLRSYTDDVVLLTKNHGTSGALSYALLYLDGRYVMTVPADTVVRPGYLDRFYLAFSRFNKVAVAGCFRNVKTDIDFIVNSKEFMPDGILLFSRDAINNIGGVCAQFKGMGMEYLEWLERARHHGWNLVTCQGVMDEIGTMHDGRSMNPKVKEEIQKSIDTYLPILDGKYKDFVWWKSGEEKGRTQCLTM